MQEIPEKIKNMSDFQLVTFEAETRDDKKTGVRNIFGGIGSIIAGIASAAGEISNFLGVFLLLIGAVLLLVGISFVRGAISDKKLYPAADMEIVRRGIEEQVKERGTEADMERYRRLQAIKSEQSQRADEAFKKGVWPFSSDAFYQRCTRSKIKSIDTQFAEQKINAIAKSMLLDAGISEKCIAEHLTPSKVQKLFDDGRTNAEKLAFEKEQQRKQAEARKKEEAERKQNTPVESKYYESTKSEFELAKKLAKTYGAAKRQIMLEAKLEPKEKELKELQEKLSNLEDAEKNKYKNAALWMAATPQEKTKDWGIAGGIAHGLGGAALGAAVALDTMQENAEIEARNKARKEAQAVGASMILNKDYRSEQIEVYAEIKDLEAEIEPLRDEILLAKDKFVFEEIDIATIQKQLKISNVCIRRNQTVKHLKVEFMLENSINAKLPNGAAAVLDGTATAKIYCGEIYVGQAVIVLPLEGIPLGKTCRVSGLSTHYLEGERNYTAEIDLDNLWVMEK